MRKIARGPARGLDFTIDFDEHLRFYLGLYETEVTPWLRRFATTGTVAYDVGADIGFQALAIARLTRAPVVAFEPQPDAAAQIERHYELNRERVGTVHVVRSTVCAAAGPGRVSLDGYETRSSLGPPGLVLIDVDGGEADVLHSAARLLRDAKPHLVVETHSLALERDCAAILERAGYRPVIVRNRRLFGDFRPPEHNRWIAAEGRRAYSGAAIKKKRSASVSAPAE
jgi:predicted RNA methylase